jgi:hypothetical protein
LFYQPPDGFTTSSQDYLIWKILEMVIVSIAVGAISFIGISTNAFVQGQGQLQQNITNIITNETRDIPQCSLAGQATGLGLDTSLFSNTTEFNACVQIIYLSPDRIVLTGEVIEGGEYNTWIWRVVDRLEKTRQLKLYC